MPPEKVKHALSSADTAWLLAAYREGLLPDWGLLMDTLLALGGVSRHDKDDDGVAATEAAMASLCQSRSK